MENMNTRGLPVSQQPPIVVAINALFIFAPMLALAWVSYSIVSGNFTWLQFGFFEVLLLITLVGTGLGYHRYFSHRSFTASRGLKIFLGILGATGGIGTISWFAALHRRHHRFTDTDRDPTTPHAAHPKDITEYLQNLWMASLGFSFRFLIHAFHLAYPEQDVNGTTKEFRMSVQDLTKDPDICRIDRNYYLIILVSILLPGFLMYLMTFDTKTILDGMIWGGLARISASQCTFGIINILGHGNYGSQPFESNDQSRNMYIFAIFSNGESLHNNHHTFPWTAKTTLAFWQIDLNYYVLCAFEKMGLASDIRVPTELELSKKRRIKSEKLVPVPIYVKNSRD